MARFTQYIGLSPAAKEFLETHSHKITGTWYMTVGIAGEEVSGNIYEVGGTGQFDEYIPTTYVEIVNFTPWSAGPMIHTCLLKLPDGTKCFEWKENEIHYD